jgi:hypothetical protein
LQDELRSCRYDRLPLFNYIGRSDVGLAVTVDINNESVMAGHFKRHESLECAVLWTG